MRPAVFFADLTHTAQGISASSFPLGVSYVMSYAQANLRGDVECTLFKFPLDLVETIAKAPPAVLAFSNYSWNFEISYRVAERAKEAFPHIVTVFGGPNFPTERDEKREFLVERPALDFYIENEGEVGFVELMRALLADGFSIEAFKAKRTPTVNLSYVHDGEFFSGLFHRIKDISEVPSPYLTGVLDPFFELPLSPMLETTRGCPFTCTFCADGLATKSKVRRYNDGRTREELYYIAERVKGVDELVITDLNFAMYPEDLETAKIVDDIREKYGYPVLLGASAGKNMPKRTIEAAKILKGVWTVGASIQSTDQEVLRSIKRQNISTEAYRELVDFGNSLKNSKTHSEIILGLPGDTKEKHFESLRFGIENRCNSIRMFQAMMLPGTEMASQSARAQFGLETKYRVIPGCTGIYRFFGREEPIAEIEEIIVASNTLSMNDYLECRIMNLLIETFHNNAVFLELFSMVEALGSSEFDCIMHLFRHPEWYPERISQIIEEFKRHTMKDLYDTREEARQVVLTPEIIEKYIGGELGTNELLIHRALLFQEFDIITNLIFRAVRSVLFTEGKMTEKVGAYLEELELFLVLRKRGIFNDDWRIRTHPFRYDFATIAEQEFKVNPNELPLLPIPVRFRFFHDDTQKRHIENQKRLYSNTPIGLGKLIQRSNLKLMYRQCEPAKCESEGEEAKSAYDSSISKNSPHFDH